ncbi:alpha-glutamyl/putrescinyl thymine pyrophosphorylase clade 3 protein [Hyphomicrobium sp. DMF-1]|uniref:alpha-glutamyl/putrescinyl thymine pyrophosphorylase clade 3 protein n=1 Tax=Hyphomicrobium sp. DMF-1 TaxID=3019544 RepID=UPI0022EC15AD|nr:hypothetical protein [Hyphomicrobium sp. DMF-1]WBT37891.1 hypothetical protein PE058_19880 [Hyphomicrobium sp. DMF-1]
MWPSRRNVAKRIIDQFGTYSAQKRQLPGVETQERKSALAWQMVASLRRLDYTRALKNRPIDPGRADPNNDLFDPERAAVLHFRDGDIDEAFWVTFLSVHFGKHGRYGWRRLRDVYSGLGAHTWTWRAYCAAPETFKAWLTTNHNQIGGAFGNHRKYSSLRTDSEQGTDKVFESYSTWVGATHSHQSLIARLVQAGGNDPNSIFDQFYRDMNVKQFGRLGKFDFLALVGRLDLAPIAPGSAYLEGATGPLQGARLLFGNNRKAALTIRELDAWLIDLNEVLKIGMQAMEDSICNWQKSPDQFIHFTG